MDVAKRHQARLKDIKEKIEQARQYFEKNIQRYNDFLQFVYETSLTSDDINKLVALKKPTIEFNILEAYINRLLGEFLKQEPTINVRASDSVPVNGLTPEFLQTMEVIEAHAREALFNTNNNAFGPKIYKYLLAGGFSVAKVFTEYLNEMSFEQNIIIDRVFDPTLTGFDPLARTSHKGDGAYCYELYPMTKMEIIERYGNDVAEEIKYHSSIGEFRWSYRNEKQKMALVCEYFEKRKKKEKIVKLTNGRTIAKKHFEEMLAMYNLHGFIEQPPAILEERWTELESIDRYIICESRVLEYRKTNYKYLPLVFFDGNSVDLKDSMNNAYAQMTRPFVYHARGIQQLMNYAGQTLAAEIENMVQHKFKVSVEAIPEKFLDAYQNVQQSSVLMYNAFYDKNPEIRLDPPMEIQRTPTPPIIESIFMGSDRITQSILGSYDGILGISGNQISGVAIQQGAMQSNAVAIPYLEGYINGLNRCAQILLDLIPKYYVTPRSLPIRHLDGKRGYQIINHNENPESIKTQYDPNNLEVKIEAGINSAVQKQVALDQITKMSAASEVFAEFINRKGLPIIVDNLDIRNVDSLKALAEEFTQELEEQQAKQAEQPAIEQQIAHEQAETFKEIEMAKIDQRQLQSESETAIQAAKVAIEKQKADANFMKIMAEIQSNEHKMFLEQERVDSENARSAVETAIDIAKMGAERNEV